MGYDVTRCDPDGPLPDVPLNNVNFSRTEMLVNLARREHLTVRQLYQRISGGRGHFQTHGTPKQIADMMEEWFTTGAADGFNFMAPVFPDGLDDFVELVVPELQRRGLYRTHYQGNTLRSHLGLACRESQYATAHK
jgi:N-acetyl-S-(2-succino)cysteine monooxygenase